MGADLPAQPAARPAPAFILQAVKDPDGAALDRIQIVKVWIDAGTYRERVFDVALSNGRRADARTGRAAPLHAGGRGAAMLTTLWRDPSFAAEQPAVYYARVLEVPTPRWSTILARRNALPLSPLVPAMIQERAWSSPIWFTPPTISAAHGRQL